jgi:hypothetical protein
MNFANHPFSPRKPYLGVARTHYSEDVANSFGAGPGDAAGADQDRKTFWASLAEAKGYRLPPSDEARAALFRSAIRAELGPAANFVKIAVHEGVLVLSGRVNSAEARKRALDCLEDLDGLSLIRNEIEVRRNLLSLARAPHQERKSA